MALKVNHVIPTGNSYMFCKLDWADLLFMLGLLTVRCGKERSYETYGPLWAEPAMSRSTQSLHFYQSHPERPAHPDQTGRRI